jgi:hypothetical protein
MRLAHLNLVAHPNILHCGFLHALIIPHAGEIFRLRFARRFGAAMSGLVAALQLVQRPVQQRA